MTNEARRWHWKCRRTGCSLLTELEGGIRLRLSLIPVAIATPLLLLVSTADAVPMVFATTLSGAHEVPPNGSPGAGTAVVVLDPTAQTLQVVASFFGLTTPDTMAHIHCCAPLGTNAGVATTVPAFPGFPLGVTQGTYLSPLFDLTQPSIYNPAFVTLEGGLSQAEAAFIAGIENDQTYFNIHTTMFPGGEIRGQLDPLNSVPEPTTLLLLGTAMTGLGLIHRRRQRQN
jgi:CHRD domain-containing protein/PEP-CTERM motif-containing protein